jgi:hypothetical protein
MSQAAINLNFARAPGFVDPRALITRATTATFIGPTGLLRTAPANAARFQYNPITLACRGYLSEPQRTNLILRSQEFDNASWSKVGVTVTANSLAAPDGTVTADTLAATVVSAYAAQSVTITAGRGVVFSCYLKAGASTHAMLQLNDGTNLVLVWFNLAAGTVGTQTGGSGTCLFSQAFCENMGRGWFRCSVEVTTATVTSLACGITPCAADAADSANGNSLYAWGAQAEAEQAQNSVSSYIPTVAATVTRNADNYVFPAVAPWFNDQAGTLVFDVVNLPTPAAYYGVAQPLYGGVGDNAFVDTIYINRVGAGTLRTNISGGGTLDRTGVSWAAGGSNKVAAAWALNDAAMVVNGGAAAVDTSVTLPNAANLVRMSIGGAPWGALSAQAVGACIFRSWQYYPSRLSNAEMQALTAA